MIRSQERGKYGSVVDQVMRVWPAQLYVSDGEKTIVIFFILSFLSGVGLSFFRTDT